MLHAAVAGLPNAGKSTLLNYMVGDKVTLRIEARAFLPSAVLLFVQRSRRCVCAFTREVLIALQGNNPYRAAGIIMQGTRHFPVCTTRSESETYVCIPR